MPEHLGQPSGCRVLAERRLEDLLKQYRLAGWGDVMTPGQIIVAILLAIAISTGGARQVEG